MENSSTYWKVNRSCTAPLCDVEGFGSSESYTCSLIMCDRVSKIEVASFSIGFGEPTICIPARTHVRQSEYIIYHQN